MTDIDDEKGMMRLYAATPSVRCRMRELESVLKDEGVRPGARRRIAGRLLPMIVPAGTKGALRGRMFNKIVEGRIRSMLARGCRLSVEKAHPLFQEIPDWVLRKGQKTLVGFNQLSLFGGGHQINRGGKYVMDDSLHRRLARRGVRMVCVVKDVPRGGGKAREIMKKGAAKCRLYTAENIGPMLMEFFRRD